MALSVSGEQVELSFNEHRVTVVEVGGGPRTYSLGDWSVLDGYPVDAMCDGGRGQPLLPWPNRLAEGSYEFGGREHQLPIDEIGMSNAIHGLTRWLNWRAVDRRPDCVTMTLTLRPRPGYPFALELRLTYQLGDDGLAIHTEATNVGSEPLPFGAGYHPYFSVGTAMVDEVTLSVPASQTLELDGRGRPTGKLFDVAGTELDFRAARPIGVTRLDTCFTGLQRDATGKATVELRGPDGRSIEVWMDASYRWAMIYSGETLAPTRRRQGLAVEPMSCPPNAFRSGEGLRVLAPGEAFRATWGIRPRR
jgi:aldose 1-epimerase